MRAICCLILISLFGVSPSPAAGFSPTPLKISAPWWLSFYNKWDLDKFSFTVSLTGTDALVTFLIFTRDRGMTVQSVRNGYLGWNYVNKTDTCVYVAPPVHLSVGANTMRWAGRDANGNTLPSADYTYYLWGIADKDVKVHAAPFPTHDIWRNPPILLQYDERGTAKANPVLWTKQAKWPLGGDPDDVALMETCVITPPDNCTLGRYACPQPDKDTYFFVEVGRSTDARQGVARYKWISSGAAILDTSWGENGFNLIGGSWGSEDDGAGVLSDRSLLYTMTRGRPAKGISTRLNAWDWQDGSLVVRLDISGWWDDPADVAAD